MKKLSCSTGSALLALSLAACGPITEEELDVMQREQPLESTCTSLGSQINAHACAHSNTSADHLSRTATSGLTSSTPNVNTKHKQYDVTLPAGAAGTVTFKPANTGSWAFYFTQNIPFALKNGTSPLSPALAHGIFVSGCSLTHAKVYDLDSTVTYQLELGAAQGNLVGLIPEELADSAVRYYRDADGDTWGDNDLTKSIRTACTQPSGYVTRRYDCNDNNPAVYSCN